MTTVSRFSRQNNVGLHALNVVLWENLVLVIVLVLESKALYWYHRRTWVIAFGSWREKSVGHRRIGREKKLSSLAILARRHYVMVRYNMIRTLRLLNFSSKNNEQRMIWFTCMWYLSYVPVLIFHLHYLPQVPLFPALTIIIINSYSSRTRRIWADIYNQRGRRPSWLLSAHIRQVREE